MFYDSELLTDKKGSLAIVWLMATLGPRSKRVTRKDIAKIDLERTCELIARPPEPMAMRLSATLLYGASRVYQHSAATLYEAVQDLDTATRRSLFYDASTGAGRRGVGGLDLIGDGTSRTDHITFPDIDLSNFLLDVDMDFGGIDWNSPDLPNRRGRRATTKFTLETWSQTSKNPEEPRDDVDDDDPVRGRDFTTTNRSNQPSRQASLAPFPNNDEVEPVETFEPIHLDLDDDPLMDDGPSISTTGPNNPFEPPHNEEVMPIDVDLPPFDPPVPNPTEDLPAPVEPEPPKAAPKKKRVKVTVDEELELDIEPTNSYNSSNQYVQQMRQEKHEKEMKQVEARARANASFLVDRWGLYLEFTDPKMDAFFTQLSATAPFQWQLDAKNKRPRSEEPAPPVPQTFDEPGPNQEWPQIEAPDWPMDEPLPAPDVPYVPDNVSVIDEPEVPRNTNPLPWTGILHDDDQWSDNFPADDISTPRRLSIMTPREIKIRSGTRSATRHRFRSRSGSVASVAAGGLDHLQLVPNDHPRVHDSDSEEDVDANSKGPYGVKLLALLEMQCREFLGYVELFMREQAAEEVLFEDVLDKAFDKIEAQAVKDDNGAALLPPGSKRRVAAAAFHNCLTLATKGQLSLDQAELHGPIVIRLADP